MRRIIKPGDRAFYINRRRYHERESSINFGVAGYFSGQAIRPGYGVTREFGTEVPIQNLITNLGMDFFGSDTGIGGMGKMHLGTGTTPPQFTDSSLDNFGVNVSSRAASYDTGNSGGAPWYSWRSWTQTSEVGGATGIWTEIGMSSSDTNGNLRSRALILDGAGSPTAFPVLADEQFRGRYELRFYPPTSDALDDIELSGVPYSTTTRALNVTEPSFWAPGGGGNGFFRISGAGDQRAYSGGLVDITATQPTGTPRGSSNSSESNAYSSGNHYRDASVRWGSNSGVGTIGVVRIRFNSALFQVAYNPIINKLSTEELILNQRVSWSRQ